MHSGRTPQEDRTLEYSAISFGFMRHSHRTLNCRGNLERAMAYDVKQIERFSWGRNSPSTTGFVCINRTVKWKRSRTLASKVSSAGCSSRRTINGAALLLALRHPLSHMADILNKT